MTSRIGFLMKSYGIVLPLFIVHFVDSVTGSRSHRPFCAENIFVSSF